MQMIFKPTKKYDIDSLVFESLQGSNVSTHVRFKLVPRDCWNFEQS